MLRKLTLDTLPSLRDVQSALVAMLPKFSEMGDRLYSELGHVRQWRLIAEMLKAAQLANDSVRDRYLAVFNDPDAIDASAIIKGKRITKDRLTHTLKSSSCVALLDVVEKSSIGENATTTSRSASAVTDGVRPTNTAWNGDGLADW